MSRRILNGWKEISSHIERGVRTAQRWEALLGMPVHRPALKDRSAVVAFTDELDRWFTRSGGKEPFARLHDNINSLARQTAELESQTKALQEKLRRSLANHRNRSASIIPIHDEPSGRSTGAMLPFRPRNNSGRQLLFP
jgi:hypothetical protein